MKDLYVSWDEYNRLVEKLALQVWTSGWSFEAVVCLARGGLRVGDVFSRLFDRPLGVLFTSSYRDDAGTTRGGLLIGEQLGSARPLPGPRWLLVDDLADTGETLLRVLPALRERHPQVREIRSAVLWRKGASVVQPDYFIEHLPTNPWIHQPFEEYDHMRPGDLKARWG
ncbi:MAG: phosphoribosyltransferase [Burkholderiaceae bacterium]|jgi:hypoxanthine phosphoribosyltransferase|nr:phosphoribosyltransferase [Burkholderiaceae bacterium]MEB2352152.1 phosphoribosyltransferase family protein [Burkholderiaceae bacterium]